MGVTKVNELNTAQSTVYLAGDLPISPALYYGIAENDVDSTEWKGGEMAFLTTESRLYIQLNTSGTSAAWYKYTDVLT